MPALTSTRMQRDVIRVDGLTLMVPFTDGAQWPSSKPQVQPVRVSLTIPHDLRPTAETDDLTHSIDYSAVVSLLVGHCTTPVDSIEALADTIFDLVFNTYPEIQDVTVRIDRPKALLHAKAAEIEFHRSRESGVGLQRIFIDSIECPVLVGINPCEREETQRICLNISLTTQVKRKAPFPFRNVTNEVLQSVKSSSFLTIEALASSVARTVLQHAESDSEEVTVRISKPSALILADAAEVEISRTLKDYSVESTTAGSSQSTSKVTSPQSLSTLLAELPRDPTMDRPLPHRAAIALGSNLGDRFSNIELALRMLESPSDDGLPRVLVVDTSFMYETAPMYVVDQPQFINCACMVETDMTPRELLAFLKHVEGAVGRTVSFRNGPRAIDLDILTYDSETLDTRPEDARSTLDNLDQELVVPHPRIAEREFVLRPLNDMIPDYLHPVLRKPINTLLTALVAAQPADTQPMYKVTPFPRYPLARSSEGSISAPPTATYWRFPVASSRPAPRRKTYIMATLNATPDSFSDGSQHNTVSTALAYAASSSTSGADIIDIGGYSTRPHAAYVSPAEESSRVVPIIKAIRSKLADVLISVDTFRGDVAEAAVEAGANCINDVYAFTGPDYPLTRAAAEHFVRMRAIARGLAVPVVLMHSRGEASAHKDYTAYAYASNAVLEGVRIELGEKVDAAVKGRGGLRRWLVLVDPGIGFSKTVEGNLVLLRNAADVTSDTRVGADGAARNPLAGFPQLVGTSRKSFLGTVLERDESGRKTRPDERVWATAAAVGCAVQQRAAIIRVHDVQEMRDIVTVSSALWG